MALTKAGNVAGNLLNQLDQVAIAASWDKALEVGASRVAGDAVGASAAGEGVAVVKDEAGGGVGVVGEVVAAVVLTALVKAGLQA